MGYQLYLNLVPMFIILTIINIIIVLRHRQEFIGRSLLLFLILTLWLLITNTLELVIVIPLWKIFFAKLEHISFSLIPITFISFSLRYIGFITKIKTKVLVPALIIPFIVIFAVSINEVHNLFWTDINFVEVSGLLTMRPDYGFLFWISGIYNYILIVLGMIFIFNSYFRGPDLYKRQSFIIVFGAIVPIVVNIIYIFKIVPSGFKDYTPIGFAFVGLLYVIGVYANRYLKIVPTARAIILDKLSTGVIVLDRNGLIIDFNQTIGEWIGLKQNIFGQYYKTSLEIQRLFMNYNPLDNNQNDYESTIEYKGLILSVQSKKIHDFADRLAGIVILLTDLTENKKKEEQLAKLKHQIIQSEKHATLGHIAAGVAHEINNPLAYISSDFRSFKMMLNLENPETKKEMIDLTLGSIDEGLDRISSVVKNLLSFFSPGGENSNYKLYNINQGIRSTLDICRSEYKGKISIILDLNPVPDIQARKNEINQVLLNMITNAVRAINIAEDKERKEFYLKIHTRLESDKIVCDLSNNGNPISKDTKSRLFIPFFTTHKKVGGLGLGLSIAKTIIEKYHEGKLTLESSDPVLFRIILPCNFVPPED